MTHFLAIPHQSIRTYPIHPSTYLPTGPYIPTYSSTYLPTPVARAVLFPGRCEQFAAQVRSDQLLSFRNPRNLQRSCLRIRIRHYLPFPECGEQRVFPGCEGSSVVKIGANFSVRRRGKESFDRN